VKWREGRKERQERERKGDDPLFPLFHRLNRVWFLPLRHKAAADLSPAYFEVNGGDALVVPVFIKRAASEQSASSYSPLSVRPPHYCLSAPRAQPLRNPAANPGHLSIGIHNIQIGVVETIERFRP
jgi:hypothetical protein